MRRDGLRRPRPGASAGDRGVRSIAEAAILTPLYIVFIFGILEFGGAFRDYLTLNNASGAGAREASISPTRSVPTTR